MGVGIDAEALPPGGPSRKSGLLTEGLTLSGSEAQLHVHTGPQGMDIWIYD